ncbi:Reversal of tor2 lethality [Agyrium rufum]|nr:Reversal of tor2 lethality [Agyrium rufum]
MVHSQIQVAFVAVVLFSYASAQASTSLLGTWTTKSRKVFTGPGFYDPVTERMFEPNVTGISYSFTDNGWFEEAYYRAVPNPGNPSCPSGVMQWQHGTYTVNANGSLSLFPLEVDGRQLESSPCSGENAIYTRYNQSEYFERFSVYTDAYHNVPRLDLFQFDGSPMNPMYLAYSPAQMLPTQTLNPTATATGRGTKSTSTSNTKQKRSMGHWQDPVRQNLIKTEPAAPYSVWLNPDNWWWMGIGMTALGSVGYFLF